MELYAHFRCVRKNQISPGQGPRCVGSQSLVFNVGLRGSGVERRVCGFAAEVRWVELKGHLQGSR